jgi:hypothetical protein
MSKEEDMERFAVRPNRPQAIVKSVLVGICVVLLGAACAGGSRVAGHDTRRPASSPLSLPAPVGLLATTGTLSVTLSWSEPSQGSSVTRYDIYRDGSPLSSVTAPTTSYTDQSVVPGKTYVYEVEAFAHGVASSRVSTVVKAGVPRLASASVEGVFDVSAKTVSESGFSNHVGGFTLGWVLTPKCGKGTCDVALSDLNMKDLRATLHRKGGTYSGSASAKLGDTCQKVQVASSLTIQFRIVKADAVDGVWKAVKLAGTLTQRDPAGLGCGSSTATFAITLKLVA